MVQHQLASHISLEAGYFRRTFGNQTVTDNESVTPADFTPFCFNLPSAQQLGVTTAVGLTSLGSLPGSQICGAYDIIPSLAGVASHQVIQFANKFPGTTSQTYNGFDFNVNAHPTGKFFVLAGVSVGKIVHQELRSGRQSDDASLLRKRPAVPGVIPCLGRLHVPMEDPGERCLSKHPSHGACGGDPWLGIFQRYVYV